MCNKAVILIRGGGGVLFDGLFKIDFNSSNLLLIDFILSLRSVFSFNSFFLLFSNNSIKLEKFLRNLI